MNTKSNIIPPINLSPTLYYYYLLILSNHKMFTTNDDKCSQDVHSTYITLPTVHKMFIITHTTYSGDHGSQGCA